VAASGLRLAGTNGVVYTRQMFGHARGEVPVAALTDAGPFDGITPALTGAGV
jgi:hypothetical protein